MFGNRELSYKVEKLDFMERIIEEKSISVLKGDVQVGSGGVRRKCTLDLLEALPSDYQSFRWKLYYGYRDAVTNEFVYYPQGVFIFINPKESEQQNGYTTSYQGVDKTQLFTDYQLDAPVTYPSGTRVKDIITETANLFGQTQYSFDEYLLTLGTLGADFTFEEGGTAEQLLNTVVSSFSCEWFFDADGVLVARRQVDPEDRHTKYVMDDTESPLYITSERAIDDANYYNKVVLVGGTVDTGIYRAEWQDNNAIANAGGRIVQRYYTRDAAVTQDQVDGLAKYYLSSGVSLPATIDMTSLVLPDIELGDIIEKGGKRYEVKSFNVPLSTESQKIGAKEIVSTEGFIS